MRFLLLVLVSGVSACTQIEDVKPPKEVFVNKLQINGVEEDIVLAEMVKFDKLPANNNYKFQLLFHTGTTTAVYQPEWRYSGVGSYFNFTLWSEDSTIASGTYSIDRSVNKSFSITKATAELNVNWSTRESDFGSYLDGTVEVKNLGNSYEITINCRDYENNPVTAYYEGEFVEIEG